MHAIKKTYCGNTRFYFYSAVRFYHLHEIPTKMKYIENLFGKTY